MYKITNVLHLYYGAFMFRCDISRELCNFYIKLRYQKLRNLRLRYSATLTSSVHWGSVKATSRRTRYHFTRLLHKLTSLFDRPVSTCLKILPSRSFHVLIEC